MNPRTDCPKYQACSAPLCPMAPESLEHGLFYGDEEVCSLPANRALPWVRRQRKVARATGRDPTRGAFTHAMLEHSGRVSAGIRGLDPEREITPERVAAWIAKRTGGEKREITPERLSQLRAQAAKMHAASKRNREGEGAEYKQEQAHPAPEASGAPRAPDTHREPDAVALSTKGDRA